MENENKSQKKKSKINSLDKSLITLILLTGIYFILFCSHVFVSLLDNKPFYSFNTFYSFIILCQNINIILHRKINKKYYNKYIFYVLIILHIIEFIFLLILIFTTFFNFSFLRLLYLTIGLSHCIHTIFFLLESLGGKLGIKINSKIQKTEDKISNYILKKLNKHRENHFEQIESLEIKIQDQINNQSGTHSNITVKSYNYSQDQEDYVTNNDKSQIESNHDNENSNNKPEKEENIIQSNNDTLDKSGGNTQFYSINNSTTSNHQESKGNTPISTNSSTLKEQINTNQINHNTNTINGSTVGTVDSSTKNEKFISELFQKDDSRLNALALPTTSSQFSAPKSVIPSSSSSISPIPETSQNSPAKSPSIKLHTPSLNSKSQLNNDSNNNESSNNDEDESTKINLFFKVFLFLFQLFYLSILILLVYRGIINYSDYRLYKKVPGQVTKINSNNKEYSLHIQCSGQGPITVCLTINIIRK